jgi:hypothetical protein
MGGIMKTAVLFALALVPFTALAAETSTTFKCETTDVIDRGNRPTKFEFAVSNLGKKNVAYSSDYGDGDSVKMVPANSVLDLNDNAEVLMDSAGNLKLQSDGDGCQWTTVLLYKSAGYKAGYAKVKGSSGCGSGDFYSTIKCSAK